MMNYTDDEAQAQTSRRDAKSVGNFEVRFTDVDSWVNALELDEKVGAIADDIVWVSVTAATATFDEVAGRMMPGGSRHNPLFASRYVEATYIARGQLQKLSKYCGISWQAEPPSAKGRENMAPRVQECAQAIQETTRALEVVLSGHPELQVRYGGSMHLHNLDEAWMAGPHGKVEPPEKPKCAYCGVDIYWANGHWRGPDRKFEVYTRGFNERGREGPIFDHEHAPEKKEETA